MSNSPAPETYEDAQKLFAQSQKDLMASDGGVPESDLPDESEFLPELEKKLINQSRVPRNSDEALKMYGESDESGELAEDDEVSEDSQETEEYVEPDEEDRKFQKSFERNVEDDNQKKMSEYLARLEQENAYLRQMDLERHKLVQEAEARAEEAQSEMDKHYERQLLYDLHQAHAEGDSVAHTRLTSELADFRAGQHTKALLKALNRYPGAQQYAQQPQQNYPQQQQRPYTQNINGYDVQTTPYNAQGQQPHEIPPPQISKAAPPAPKQRVAAPTQQRRAKAPESKLDRDEMMMINSMPWVGSDGKPMKFEDKKKLYIASNSRR